MRSLLDHAHPPEAPTALPEALKPPRTLTRGMWTDAAMHLRAHTLRFWQQGGLSPWVGAEPSARHPHDRAAPRQ